jgi:type II secretory pathway predicted ATPase ExeA
VSRKRSDEPHASTWLRHFGLTSVPFDKDIDDDELWLPESKQALVDDLVEAVEARQHALLVGEPGVGKTCTLRALRRRLPESGYRLTYCHNASLGRRDFYRQLCVALGLSSRASAAGLFHLVSTHVQELGRERVHPVLLLDEAHLLHHDVLAHLHVLANYQWDQKPLLSLVLVGLPELWNHLALGRNRSLWTRIHCRRSIEGAAVADTSEYVSYRLARAGTNKPLLSSDALTILHQATQGQLRDIDRLVGNALRQAARRKLAQVDRALLEQVLERDQQPGWS